MILSLRPSVGNFKFRSILNGVEYKFRVKFNRRELAYYLDVFEISDKLVAAGLKIVLGAYIGREIRHPLFTEGVLVARIPRGDDRREAQFDDLGTRVEVWYFTKEEMFVEIVSALTGVSA